MSRLIESIKLLDGKFHNLSYHEQRMRRSLQMLFGNTDEIDLESCLRENEVPEQGLYKCRIVYDDRSREISFIPYEPKLIRRLKVVDHDRISYDHKFANREIISSLFELRGDCDDILIIKRGMVTDCSFSNIVFRKGTSWWTPWSALLKGTMRQSLIDNNLIREDEINRMDIQSFDSFRLINAMLGFESPEIEVSNIVL